MANAYDPYKDLQDVYNAKVAYGNATTDEERLAQQQIANQARANLASNGHSDLVKQVSASGANAQQTKTVVDKWAKTGKQEIRPYLYNSKLTKQYGLNNSDIDSLLSFDELTGEVSLGGKKIGKPYSLVDGVSYWDSSVLDSAIDDYITRSGITASDANMAAKNTAEVNTKVNDLWGIQKSDRETMADKYNKLEDTAYSNPFTTDEAKAILSKYDLAGLQGRNNAVASGGASNGGNIDSYAAANAMRQQAALVNQGQMAVLDAHNNKINNVKGILESLGFYQQNQDASMQNTIGLQQTEAQRNFDNDQTAKLNDTAIKSTIAEVTGLVPNEWILQNNPYIGDDGKLKPEYENVDFQQLLNEARKNGASEQAIKDLQTARGVKMLKDWDKYGKYSENGDYLLPGQEGAKETASYELGKKQLDDETYLALLSLLGANNSLGNSSGIIGAGIGNKSNIVSELLKNWGRMEGVDLQNGNKSNGYSGNTDLAALLNSSLNGVSDGGSKTLGYPTSTSSKTTTTSGGTESSGWNTTGNTTKFTGYDKTGLKAPSSNEKKFYTALNKEANKRGWPDIVMQDGTYTTYGANRPSLHEMIANQILENEGMLTDTDENNIITRLDISPGTLDTVLNSRRYKVTRGY